MTASRWAVMGCVVSGLCLAGCGATGLSWVSEAHVQATQHTVAHSSAHTSGRVIPAPVEQPLADAPRPRLSRTVTLGEAELMGPSGRSSSSNAPRSSSGVSVTVNNYNVLNAPSVGYGYSRGYGSLGPYRGYAASGGSLGYSRPSFPSVPAGGSPQAGQNWPAISDYGPSFPLRAAPAAPWSRTP